jgi:hypothetical protein
MTKPIKIYYHEGDYFFQDEDGEIWKADMFKEDEDGSGYSLPENAHLIKEYYEPVYTKKLFVVDHEWATVVEAEDQDEALEIATKTFLEDYNLKAYGRDLLESMRSKEIQK